MNEYTRTEEFRRMLDVLVEEIGVDPREAETSLQDGDLWPLIHVGGLHPFEGEEGIKEWEEAVATLDKLVHLFDDNPALVQTFVEASIRGEEMLRRLKARARG